MVVGQFALDTNLVVIGGGAGGYAAALRAAKLGVDTMLVDGAVPAPGKAPGPSGGSWTGLRRLRELLRLRTQATDLGAAISTPDFSLPALQQHMRESVLEAAERREEQCRAADVNVVQGVARIEDARQITVHGGPNARVRFKRAIIATGARPMPPTGGWPKSKRVSDWLGAWRLEALPETLLVVGGGSIAVEMAGAFAALGSRLARDTAGEGHQKTRGAAVLCTSPTHHTTSVDSPQSLRLPGIPLGPGLPEYAGDVRAAPPFAGSVPTPRNRPYHRKNR